MSSARLKVWSNSNRHKHIGKTLHRYVKYSRTSYLICYYRKRRGFHHFWSWVFYSGVNLKLKYYLNHLSNEILSTYIVYSSRSYKLLFAVSFRYLYISLFCETLILFLQTNNYNNQIYRSIKGFTRISSF